MAEKEKAFFRITNKSRALAVIIAVIMTVTMMPFMSGQTGTAQAKAKSEKYWLKINRQRGVVTAYKKVDGKWKPVRAMLTSVGTGYRTPLGTFRLKEKYRWKLLMLDSKGRYCSRITGGILFHSVCYDRFTKTSQQWWEFNKLGHKASHGCCRLSLIDAMWIYDNVKTGSKVTIYDSKKAGPLGKPKALKSHSGWDPTDISKRNPNFKLKKAKITISKKKKKTVEYGAKYTLKAGVKAYNPNANEKLTDRLKVSVQKKVNGKWKTATFSTESPGTYKVTYKIKYKYCRNNKKSIIIKVKKAPKKQTTDEQTDADNAADNADSAADSTADSAADSSAGTDSSSGTEE